MRFGRCGLTALFLELRWVRTDIYTQPRVRGTLEAFHSLRYSPQCALSCAHKYQLLTPLILAFKENIFIAF